jgi:hypothetical protein
MFWHVRLMDGAVEQGAMPCGRFVLHRHCDADGPHLDLRLEAEGYAVGYRIGGSALEDGAWATEKMPHPVDWLERDGDAVREDSGVYALRAETAEYREVALHGERGVMVLRFEREASLDAAAARAVALALRELRADATQAAPLMRDGMTARRRALERICALGRELDGHVFDEAQWRQMLAPLGLDKLHAQLQSFERRFNAKYPARPVSTPEPLDEAEEAERVLALLRG